MKITQELLMKAAKFQQNHKIKADMVEFDEDSETIIFYSKTGHTVAWVDYNNNAGNKEHWVLGG